MEISLKINFPTVSSSGSQSLKQIKMPKSLKISYEYEFDNSKYNINNENKQDNEIMIHTSEIILNKDPILNQKDESKKAKLDDENNKLNLNHIVENIFNDDENHMKNPYENNQTLRKEEKCESSDKNEKFNINQNAEISIIDPSINSKKGYDIIKNKFKGRSRLIEKEEINNDYKNEEIPSEVVEDLFVMGINDKISENDLLKTFSAYGEVVYSKIIKNKFTHKAKGIAFVKFKERKSALYAMTDNGKIFCKGYPLKIKYNIKNKENKYFNEENTFNPRKSNKEEKTSELSQGNRERSRDKDIENGEILDD
jgi:RNA recognition motif-containing protein